jgi:hypothetical protein
VSRLSWPILLAACVFAVVSLPADQTTEFHLTYTTYPLAGSGDVDRSQPPTRYWYKGHRSRIDNFRSGGTDPQLAQSFIMDCDSSRMITIDWSEKTYTIMTFAEWQRMMEQMMRMASRFGGAQVGAPDAPAARTGPGGTVTVTTVWRDSMLDERRFGLPVRWTSMSETSEASADACYAGAGHSEIQRWITDLDLPLCIPPFDVKAMSVPMTQTPQPACEDRVVERTEGAPRTGFVLREWTTSGNEVSGWEVTELSRDSLPDSLFAAPPGFRRVETEMPDISDADMDAAAAAMAGAPGAGAAPAPKAAGAVRVGVAVGLPPEAPADPHRLAADVAAWIRDHGLDAVALRAGTPDAAMAEAPTVEADYVLYYDVEKAEMKVSGRGMLGAAIGGAIGGRAGGGAMQLEVEGRYDLRSVPAGDRVADGKVDEKEAAEDPQAQLAGILQGAAGEAIAKIRR